jgi:hypothetical protein
MTAQLSGDLAHGTFGSKAEQNLLTIVDHYVAREVYGLLPHEKLGLDSP